MAIRRILLDMDQVLVDFLGGVSRVFGTTTANLQEHHWPRGHWDILLPLGSFLGLPGPLSMTEFWDRINEEQLDGFWECLDELPWFGELIALVEQKVGDEWAIVSDPSLLYGASGVLEGKQRWLASRFGHRFDKLLPWNKKHWLANPTTLLIDDSDKNVRDFRRAGGLAYLFPGHHNSAHEQTAYAMDHLRSFLNL